MATTQYNSTNKVQSLVDLITNISPSDTPLVSLFGKGTPATQVVHTWEEDELEAPKDNAQKEGFEYEVADPKEPTLKQNVCQIFSRGFGVTESSQATHRHNIKDKMAYHMAQAMKLLAMDLERATIVNDKMSLGTKADARKMGGLPFFLKSNVLTNSAKRALTFELLNDGLEAVYKAGGSPDLIVCSPRNKRILTAVLPTGTTRTVEQKAKKITARIDVFEGDFGVQRVVTDRWMSDDQVFILSSEYFGYSYLREPVKQVLPKTADVSRSLIVQEVTLEARAEKASAVIDKLDGKLPAKV